MTGAPDLLRRLVAEARAEVESRRSVMPIHIGKACQFQRRCR